MTPVFAVSVFLQGVEAILHLDPAAVLRTHGRGLDHSIDAWPSRGTVLADLLPVAAQGDRDSTKGEIEKMLERSDVAKEFVPDMRFQDISSIA